MPDDAEAKVLMAQAQAERKKPSRGLWILAIVISVICVGSLAYGVINYWDEPAQKTLERKATSERAGSGFGLGLMIGIGAGIAIGSVIALRRRH